MTDEVAQTGACDTKLIMEPRSDLRRNVRAFGIFYFVTSVAALFSSIATGELWRYFCPALPFYVSASLAATAMLMVLLVPRSPKHIAT
jgi:dipeptide/tripeptide permease